MKMWLHACPKCSKGDLYLEKDIYGWCIHCLQCGYVRDIEKDVKVPLAKTAQVGQKDLVTAGR